MSHATTGGGRTPRPPLAVHYDANVRNEPPLTLVQRALLDEFDRLLHAHTAEEAADARRGMRALVALMRVDAGVADPDSQKRSPRDSDRERRDGPAASQRN
jgi:hypothetical protein